MFITVILGPEENKALQQVKEFAEKKENYNDIFAVMEGRAKAPGFRKEYVCHLPSTHIPEWKVVYSIDVGPCGLIKHLSMSGSKHRPNEGLISLIAVVLELEDPDIMTYGLEEVVEQDVLHYIVFMKDTDRQKWKAELSEQTQEPAQSPGPQ